MNSNLRLAGIVGFLGVALGAFGAHGLRPRLELFGTAWIWEKAVLYHLVHAVVLLVLAQSAAPMRRWVPVVLAVGIAVFSGSLYLLAVTNLKWLGAITPLGGLCLLAGWLGVAWVRRG